MTANTTVVIVTRNRANELTRTLDRLGELRPAPPVIVVDNASTDHTVHRVRQHYPGVRLLASPVNAGAAGRDVGVRAAETSLVAFSDDDSWWAPNSLSEAENRFGACPRLGLLAARILVGPTEEEDPVCRAMAESPLGSAADLPGPRILGFLGCAAVVRRSAYLDAGGFSALLHFGAEEKLFAYDLAARNWQLCYDAGIVAHHHPSSSRPAQRWRHRREDRNNALIAAMRRPASAFLRALLPVLRHPATAVETARMLPSAVRARRRLPRHVEDQIAALTDGARSARMGHP